VALVVLVVLTEAPVVPALVLLTAAKAGPAAVRLAARMVAEASPPKTIRPLSTTISVSM
jgi:hypothetical protein